MTKHDHQTAIEHSRTREGRSVVDATIAVAMGRLDVEFRKSVDDGFDQVTGVTRSPVAGNTPD